MRPARRLDQGMSFRLAMVVSTHVAAVEHAQTVADSRWQDALSGLLQGDMAAEAGPPEPVFVEHFEQRRPVGKNAKKLPASNFYLRDSLGRQHLAGQADAHGDAHYTYHNTKAFGARYGEVSCHNKKEMISYLDRIIQVATAPPGASSPC